MASTDTMAKSYSVEGGHAQPVGALHGQHRHTMATSYSVGGGACTTSGRPTWPAQWQRHTAWVGGMHTRWCQAQGHMRPCMVAPPGVLLRVWHGSGLVSKCASPSGSGMDLVWILYGSGMDLAWTWHGSGTDLAWIWHGSGMDLAWIGHGSGLVSRSWHCLGCRVNGLE